MKSLGLILGYMAGSSRQRNLRLVGALLAVLVVMVAAYTVVFHWLMAREGRDHSWATGVYWTLTVMSTLGFGDITFESDAGRIFSVVVLVSGALFILVLLPFVFIQFVFMPWVAWRDANRTPRLLPEDTSGHVVLAGDGPVIDAVVRRAADAGVAYVLIVADPVEALAHHDAGRRVMVGDLDEPDTYRAARVGAAALVATTGSDPANTNIAFTVREISDEVPIVATASYEASVDILELAGCDEVLQLGELLGRAVARRVLGRDGRSQVIGELGDLRIAEATATHPELVGRTLRRTEVRERANVHVVGTWERGTYQPAGPETLVEDGTVLVLAGSDRQLEAYDAAYGIPGLGVSPVIVIGGGRVGRAAGRVLAEAGFPYKLVEKRADRVSDAEHHVQGDAADLAVLEAAGIREASAVLITTHEDDVNVYLTIYCRRLRPDIQVISRANADRNVATLHRAGADAVLSYASLGASAIWNALGLDDTVVLAEGLEVVRVPVPTAVAGRTLAQSEIRGRTGCTVVAVTDGGALTVNPSIEAPLPVDGELVLIADPDSQRRFSARYRADPSRVHRRARVALPAPVET